MSKAGGSNPVFLKAGEGTLPDITNILVDINSNLEALCDKTVEGNNTLTNIENNTEDINNNLTEVNEQLEALCEKQEESNNILLDIDDNLDVVNENLVNIENALESICDKIDQLNLNIDEIIELLVQNNLDNATIIEILERTRPVSHCIGTYGEGENQIDVTAFFNDNYTLTVINNETGEPIENPSFALLTCCGCETDEKEIIAVRHYCFDDEAPTCLEYNGTQLTYNGCLLTIDPSEVPEQP